MRTRRNRRSRAGRWRRPIGVVRRMLLATFAMAGRSHVITRPPAAVVGPGRLVDARDISPGSYRAGIQHREQQETERTHLPTSNDALDVHFGSLLLSVSDHSINPNGAPIGSATTATLPPWRSTCGSTSTRPPRETTRAATSTASTTRTKLSQWG